jgi:GNAT superfamily N-acetyltransferase
MVILKIRKYRDSDLKDVARLISKTFGRFNSDEGSKKSVENYIDTYTPLKKNLVRIKENFDRCAIFYVAVDGEKIIGIVRGREDKIVNLFVDGEYHKRGVARRLIVKFEKVAKDIGSKSIKINSSLYAIPFYEKMGYKKVGSASKLFGLNVQKMRKRL